jgi:hypothetical protein
MKNPKSYTSYVIDCNDGTGDCMIEFPDELIQELGWKDGIELDLKVDPAGNVIVITPVTPVA